MAVSTGSQVAVGRVVASSSSGRARSRACAPVRAPANRNGRSAAKVRLVGRDACPSVFATCDNAAMRMASAMTSTSNHCRWRCSATCRRVSGRVPARGIATEPPQAKACDENPNVMLISARKASASWRLCRWTRRQARRRCRSNRSQWGWARVRLCCQKACRRRPRFEFRKETQALADCGSRHGAQIEAHCAQNGPHFKQPRHTIQRSLTTVHPFAARARAQAQARRDASCPAAEK